MPRFELPRRISALLTVLLLLARLLLRPVSISARIAITVASLTAGFAFANPCLTPVTLTLSDSYLPTFALAFTYANFPAFPLTHSEAHSAARSATAHADSRAPIIRAPY